MTVANDSGVTSNDAGAAADPRQTGRQLRAGLWQTINDRYPGSMIRKDSFVPQARLSKSLAASRLALVSSCGVHLKTDQPLDVCHPFGDFRFSRVPSDARHQDLIIHQLKYPHDDADLGRGLLRPVLRPAAGQPNPGCQHQAQTEATKLNKLIWHDVIRRRGGADALPGPAPVE